MSFLGKTYTLVSQENFDLFLKSAGLPDEQIAKISEFKSTNKLVQNGDTYTFSNTAFDGAKEVSFKSGVEFDDTINNNSVKIKNKFVVDGNTVTQTITAPQGTAIFKREYNGDDLVLTITSSSWDGIAKRFFKA